MLPFLSAGALSAARQNKRIPALCCRGIYELPDRGSAHLKVDYTSCPGALLHDYFLYDWHVPNAETRLHGLRHPRRALQNAREDFALTPLEADIILRHMFPLTLVPPACPEGWAVCMADKLCALLEPLRPAGWERKWPYVGAPRPPAA